MNAQQTEQQTIELNKELEKLIAERDKLAKERETYRTLYLDLLEKYKLLENGIINQRSERLPPNEAQLSLQILDELLQAAQKDKQHNDDDANEPETPVIPPKPKKKKKKPTGRKPPPENLPRVDIEVLPPEVEREGLDAFERIGEEVTEVVERRQASFVVVRITRPKFVRKAKVSSDDSVTATTIAPTAAEGPPSDAAPIDSTPSHAAMASPSDAAPTGNPTPQGVESPSADAASSGNVTLEAAEAADVAPNGFTPSDLTEATPSEVASTGNATHQGVENSSADAASSESAAPKAVEAPAADATPIGSTTSGAVAAPNSADVPASNDASSGPPATIDCVAATATPAGAHAQACEESADGTSSTIDVEQPRVLIGEPLALPIPRGLAGPGLLADSIVRRWQDHMPANRLGGIYARDGFPLARSTICSWHEQLASLAKPLIAAMWADALTQSYLYIDATGVLVQAKHKCKRAHFWVTVAPMLHVLFAYTRRHNKEAVDGLLAGYEGYLVADAHSVYDHLYATEKIIEVACWAHCRRYFFKAISTDPERARHALALIGGLFRIERELADAQPIDRLVARQARSAPLVEMFLQWCDAQIDDIVDESPIAKGIGYARNQRTPLQRFLEDGRLPIHNNISELQLRREAIGRKNWLFVGSDDGGETHSLRIHEPS